MICSPSSGHEVGPAGRLQVSRQVSRAVDKHHRRQGGHQRPDHRMPGPFNIAPASVLTHAISGRTSKRRKRRPSGSARSASSTLSPASRAPAQTPAMSLYVPSRQIRDPLNCLTLFDSITNLPRRPMDPRTQPPMSRRPPTPSLSLHAILCLGNTTPLPAATTRLLS